MPAILLGPANRCKDQFMLSKKAERMSDTEERKKGLAADLFGAVKKPQATGEYYIDLATASAPLVQDETVIRAACLGCGICLELLPSGAERLAKLAGVQKLTSWDGYYFAAQRCPLCDRDYREVVLQHVRDLKQ